MSNLDNPSKAEKAQYRPGAYIRRADADKPAGQDDNLSAQATGLLLIIIVAVFLLTILMSPTGKP